MFERLNGLSIRMRMFLLAGLMVVGVCMNAVTTFANLRASMIDDRKEKIRNLTESTYAIVDHYYHLSMEGSLGQDEAKSVVKEIRRILREHLRGNKSRSYRTTPRSPRTENAPL